MRAKPIGGLTDEKNVPPFFRDASVRGGTKGGYRMSYEENDRTERWDAERVREAERTQPSRSSGERSKRRKKKRCGGFLLWLVFVLLVSALLAGVGWLLANDFCAFNKDPVTTTIEVTKDDDINTVADKLKQEGLIEYEWLFKLFGKLAHAESKIGIGSYELNSKMDYKALINGMRNRNAALNANTVKVTVPEGYTVRQIAALLAEYGVNTEAALLDAARNGSFEDYYFVPQARKGTDQYLEGYLFPDTYEFFVGEDPVKAYKRFLNNFDVKMNEDMMNRVQESGRTLDEILVIASLIERETDGTDRAKIASVIYNRLNNVGETYHLLQIDASLIYGLGDQYTGKLTEADLAFDSPYNLSKYPYLPPTPIGNPGLAAIEAALDPAETGYYFYARGQDNLHHFFRTYEEHLAFVNSSDYKG